MADGCIKALEEMGVEKPVYLSGQDATIDGVKNIVAGKQQMTAFHPLKEAASQAAEVMLMLVRNDSKVSSLINDTTNNGQIDVPTLKVPSIAVTKENVDQVLIKEAKFYTREQIYE